MKYFTYLFFIFALSLFNINNVHASDTSGGDVDGTSSGEASKQEEAKQPAFVSKPSCKFTWSNSADLTVEFPEFTLKQLGRLISDKGDNGNLPIHFEGQIGSDAKKFLGVTFTPKAAKEEDSQSSAMSFLLYDLNFSSKGAVVSDIPFGSFLEDESFRSVEGAGFSHKASQGLDFVVETPDHKVFYRKGAVREYTWEVPLFDKKVSFKALAVVTHEGDEFKYPYGY